MKSEKKSSQIRSDQIKRRNAEGKDKKRKDDVSSSTKTR
jgi:hypothetical protein